MAFTACDANLQYNTQHHNIYCLLTFPRQVPTVNYETFLSSLSGNPSVDQWPIMVKMIVI